MGTNCEEVKSTVAEISESTAKVYDLVTIIPDETGELDELKFEINTLSGKVAHLTLLLAPPTEEEEEKEELTPNPDQK